MSMTIKVAKLGGEVKSLFLADGATMEQALEAAGLDKTGFDLRVNGRTPCGTLKDGDMVTLVPAIKGGGEISVKVAKLGGEVKEVLVSEGSSLDSVLGIVGFDKTGFDVRVNGRSEYGTLKNGDMVTLVPAIKGGC